MKTCRCLSDDHHKSGLCFEPAQYVCMGCGRNICQFCKWGNQARKRVCDYCYRKGVKYGGQDEFVELPADRKKQLDGILGR